METLIPIIGAAISGAYVILRFINKQGEVNQYNLLFKKIAEALKLNFKKGSMLGFPRVYGIIDGLRVSIEMYTDKDKVRNIIIVIHFYLHIMGDFEIQLKTTMRKIAVAVVSGGVETGDGAFDDAMLVSASDHSIISALMSRTARKNILELAGENTDLQVTKSGIRIYLPFAEIQQTKKLVRCLGASLSLGKELTRDEDIRRRLMENIGGDDAPGIRLRNIHALMARFPVNDEIRGLLRKNLKDHEVAIQVESAFHLGDEGAKHLMGLLDGRIALGNDLVILIVKMLKERSYRGAVPALKGLLAGTKNRDLVMGILEAFEAIGDERVSDLLTQRLKDEDSDIRMLAIRALGTCGTVSAVEPLDKLAGDSINPFVRSAVHASIEQIQARLGRVERGWLSVAELSDKEGGLSIADKAEAGSLSMEPEKKDHPPGVKKKKRKKAKNG
jgi:hypothetical protein